MEGVGDHEEIVLAPRGIVHHLRVIAKREGVSLREVKDGTFLLKSFQAKNIKEAKC